MDGIDMGTPLIEIKHLKNTFVRSGECCMPWMT